METLEKKLYNNKNIDINKETATNILNSYLKLNKHVANNQSINEHTYSSNIKLEEMITLEVIKSSKLTGITKKMLHVLSMKVFIVKVYYCCLIIYLGNTYK